MKYYSNSRNSISNFIENIISIDLKWKDKNFEPIPQGEPVFATNLIVHHYEAAQNF